MSKPRMKKSEQEKLDEAVALVLKYQKELSEIQLKALYFSLYVEHMERSEAEDKL